MVQLAFVAYERDLIIQELEKVEGAWVRSGKVGLFDKDGTQLVESIFEERDYLPGFTVIVREDEITDEVRVATKEFAEVLLVTSKKTTEGVWLSQGWLKRQTQRGKDAYSKITLGMYIPSIYCGTLILMSAEDVQKEEQIRLGKGNNPLPIEVCFMRWEPEPHEEKALVFRALEYTIVNTDDYADETAEE